MWVYIQFKLYWVLFVNEYVSENRMIFVLRQRVDSWRREHIAFAIGSSSSHREQ